MTTATAVIAAAAIPDDGLSFFFSGESSDLARCRLKLHQLSTDAQVVEQNSFNGEPKA